MKHSKHVLAGILSCTFIFSSLVPAYATEVPLVEDSSISQEELLVAESGTTPELPSTEAESTEVESTEAESTEVETTEAESTEAESTEVETTEVESTEVETTEAESAEVEESTEETTGLNPSTYTLTDSQETPKNAHSEYVQDLIADWEAQNDIARPESNIYGSGLDGATVVGHEIDQATLNKIALGEEASNIIYLKDTDAQPNDAICDREVIQELMDTADFGTVIVFEEGRYDFLMPESESTDNALVLVDGVSLLGQGMWDSETQTGTLLKMDATQNTASTVRFLYGQGVTNFTVKGMTLDSVFTGDYPDTSTASSLQITIKGRNSGEMSHGIYIDAKSTTNVSEFFRIEDVSVESFRTYAINVRNTNNVVIKGCAFQYATNLGGGGAGYGVAIQGTTDTDRHGLAYDSFYNVVEECMILGPVLRHGILIQYFSHNNLIHNNLLYGTGYGAIDMHGEEEYLNEISHNVIDNISHGGGIEVGNSGSGHHRTGPLTYIHHNTVTNSRRGIDVEWGTMDTIVENNTVKDLTGGLLPYDGNSGIGIFLRYNYRSIVRDNEILGDFKYGVFLNSYWGVTYTDSTNSAGEQKNFGAGPSTQAEIYNNRIEQSGDTAYDVYDCYFEGELYKADVNDTYVEGLNQSLRTNNGAEYEGPWYTMELTEEAVSYHQDDYYVGFGVDNILRDLTTEEVESYRDLGLDPESYPGVLNEGIEDKAPVITESNNAHLVALVLEDAEAEFTHYFFPEYSVQTLNTTKSTLNLTPYQSASVVTSITVDGKEVKSGETSSVNLEAGENKVVIEVVAEDGESTMSYNLIANLLDSKASKVDIDSATANVSALVSEDSEELLEAGNAIDGNLYSFWAGDISEDDNAELTLSLTEESLVSRVDIAWHEGTSYTMDFSILTSMDGEDWTEVYSVLDNTGYTEGYVSYLFEAVEANFVKISVANRTEFDLSDFNNSFRLALANTYQRGAIRGVEVYASEVTEAKYPVVSQETTVEDDVETTVVEYVSGVIVTTVVDASSDEILTAEIVLPEEGEKVSVLIPAGSVELSSSTVPYVDGETLVKASVVTDLGLELIVNESCNIVVKDNEKTFADADSAQWFSDSADFVSSRELFVGVGKNLFDHGSDMNVAMLVTVLYSLDGADFDSDGGKWYSKSVDWASSMGILEDTDSVDDSITRENLVSILYNYGALVSDVTGEAVDLSEFADFEDVSSEAEEAIQWAYANDILGGTNKNKIEPQGTATRAEVATFVASFVQWLVGA